MVLRLDLHLHTKFSKDCLMVPEKIIKKAREKDLSGVAVADHDTIRGALEVYRANKHKNFIVIKASEIKTEYGDIIGLFIKNEIQVKDFIAVSKEIRRQSGLVVLPHPYSKNTKFPEKLISEHIDLIEVFNARQKKEKNNKALDLAKKYKKPIVAGSDAHNYFEIGRGYMELNVKETNEEAIKACLLSRSATYQGKTTPYLLSHGLSCLIEKYKNCL